MVYRVLGRRGVVCFASLLLASTSFVPPASAQSSSGNTAVEVGVYDFNLQPSSLASTVARIGAVSGWRIFYGGGVPSDTLTNAVSGQLTVTEALGRALQGTGLQYELTGSRSVSIVSAMPIEDDVSYLDDGVSTFLDPVYVTTGAGGASGAGFMGTPDWVYDTAGSLSVVSRDAILASPSRNARDLLDNVAGVYANRSNGQDPGISVNIRGLQDQNRVVTMVDGARQNFQIAGHGSTSRAYVDSAFIREIDIDKMGGSGVGGAGNLGGSVNFRTLIADDVILPGNDWGLSFNGASGSNEFQYDGSIVAATRITDNFSVLGGYSRKKMGAYNFGTNGDVEINPETTIDGISVFTGSEVESSILKGEAYLGEDIELTLTWLRNSSEFSTGGYIPAGPLEGGTQESRYGVVNNTVTANLGWNPLSDLVDLDVSLWYNHLQNDQEFEQLLINTILSAPAHYRLGTIGGSIDNTSFFDTRFGDLTVNYGIEGFHDDGKTTVDADFPRDGLTGNEGLTGPNPTGTRDVFSGFASATLEPTDWLSLTGGLRYDWYRIKGIGSYARMRLTPDTYECHQEWSDEHGEFRRVCTGERSEWEYLKEDVDIDRSDGAFLPSVTAAFGPWDGLQPFVRYAKTFRPPTLMEQLWGGQHYIGSAPLTYAPNPGLKAESANTYEIGVNYARDGWFRGDDSFRMKAVGFFREVDNYIALGHVYKDVGDRVYQSFVNLDGESYMKGIEFEANYDVGRFYVGASATILSTDYADTYTYHGENAHGSGTMGLLHDGDVRSSDTLYVPPTFYLTMDAGLRFFDERLTVGGRLTHSSGGKAGELRAYDVEDYTVYDIYGSWEFNETAALRFAVDNVTNLAYVPSMGTADLPAPGRTFTASLNLNF
ncbi:UNVERIFIED_ORG: hemoglobin/transferrin/lactoferrin receptor protein [Martelella mediterranea]